MTIIQALVLGIVQGLTEFLPISSSGHLVFLPHIFGWGDQGLTFDVMVHLGSLVAVVVYFRRKLWLILKSMFCTEKKKMQNDEFKMMNYQKLGWLIILTIVPAGIVGFFFGDWMEINFRATWIVGVGLIFWGIVLGVADRYQRTVNSEQRAIEKITWKNALFIGCAQAVALIPGTSRSGITMTAGLLSKLDKKSAAEFSFLMSVPIIALAGGLKIIELMQTGLDGTSSSVLAVGFAAAAASGFLAIAGLMKIIERWSFMPFVFYRVVVGILILLFLN